MQQIYSDLNEAETILPLDYVNLTNISQVPAKYTGVSMEEYNRVFGYYMNQRISGRIVKASKSQGCIACRQPCIRSQYHNNMGKCGRPMPVMLLV